MKVLRSSDSFMLDFKLGDVFFSASELLYPNLKVRLRIIRVRPKIYVISDNTSISIGIVDCSLCTRRSALEDDYHKKRTDMLVITPVVFNYLETLAKIFVFLARQNHFIEEKIFNNTPVRRIVIAMNTNSSVTGS